jgi:hypothetical protein
MGKKAKKGWYIKQTKSPMGIIGPWGSQPGHMAIFDTKKQAQRISGILNRRYRKEGYRFAVRRV